MAKKESPKEVPGNLLLACAAANIAEKIKVEGINASDPDLRLMAASEVVAEGDFQNFDWSDNETAATLDSFVVKKLNLQLSVSGSKGKIQGEQPAKKSRFGRTPKADKGTKRDAVGMGKGKKFLQPAEFDLQQTRNLKLTPQSDNTILVEKKGGRGKDNIGWNCPDGSKAEYEKLAKDKYKIGCAVDD